MTRVDDNQPGNDTRKHPSADSPIPPRKYIKQARNTAIAPQPSMKHHNVRILVGTAIGLVLMLVLLMMAMKYAERDWSQKHQRARAARIRPVIPETSLAVKPEPLQGWSHSLSTGATDRYLQRLASDRHLANGWLVLGRGLSSRKNPQEALASLRMAMAAGGESAAIKNDFGAAYLEQRRMRQATAQFQAAIQIEPGFPPALFNLALCAIAERNPAAGSRFLAQYLARRPDDTAAYRLQSTLLAQAGRQADALRMLEKFLRHQPADQPLFLEAAVLAARLGHHGNAIRYLETSLNGNSIQSVVRAFQSPAFREIRLSSDGTALAARLASRARVAFGAPLPVQEIQPLRANPEPAAIVR